MQEAGSDGGEGDMGDDDEDDDQAGQGDEDLLLAVEVVRPHCQQP